MKKIFILIFILTLSAPVSAQFVAETSATAVSPAVTNPCPSSGEGLNYEMTSYTANNKDANTPFFNVSFLNKPCFQINYLSFSNAWQFLFDAVIGISIATAVIVFMFGAFEGIIDSKSTSSVKKGKDRMQNAIIGLMVILSTWLIINTINPDLLRLPIFQGLDKLNTNGTNNTTTTGTQNTTVSNNP